MKRILKKTSTLIIGSTILALCACSGNLDEIAIGEDGSNNRNAIVSFIDDYSFYIDYIEYQIVDSHVEVVGYDEIEHVTYIKPYARITIDGTTYETMAIRGKCKERRFSDCTLVNYFSALPRSIEKIDIPSTVTEIGEGAFANLGISSIVIPEGVVSIGDGAFSGCQNLDSISLPSTLRFIGHHAFFNCKSLENICLPESLTEISWDPFRLCGGTGDILDYFASGACWAFSGCSSLKRVDCYAEKPPVRFWAGPSDIDIHVPASSLQAYQEEWRRVNNVIGDL